ncbi:MULTISPECIES: prephenate dehydrogenase dimerization domain-containing protein [unclassified Streptomyces]|uniref:prephenate dehydrogenase dimerization domain-containing protein n=1 Tax=unclassified Streptomyces TaxID=2593676 RepID=UPI0033324793
MNVATTDPVAAPRRITLLGAAGTVGRWYRSHLTGAGDTVTTADLAPGTDHDEDVRTPSQDLRSAVACADEVVLALPEEVAAACLPWLAESARPEAVIVSTCSVQLPLFDAASELGVRPRLRGVNPMFSPTLPAAGQSVVVITPEPASGTDPHVGRMSARLGAGGMTVTVMGPADHDAAMSVLQALPHAAILSFVDAFLSAPVDVPTLMRIAPPPARTLVALACRILAAPPEIYWDIQRVNAESGARRKDLMSSLQRLGTLVDADRAADFHAALASAAEQLGPYAAEGAQECQELFELVQRRRTTRQTCADTSRAAGPRDRCTRPFPTEDQPGDRRCP